jgi:hypothetical protein
MRPASVLEHRIAIIAGLIFGLAALLLGLLIVRAPLPVLLDRFIPDDAFYYLQPAKQFALTGFSSFDGLNFTNGYQPLWFLALVPLFWLIPEGGDVALYASLAIQVVLSVATAFFLMKTLSKYFGASNALIAGVLWLVVFHRVLLNGLETALQAFLYVATFFATLKVIEVSQRHRRRLLAGLGVLGGLLFLARTDAIFSLLALGFAVFFGNNQSWRNRFLDLLVFVVPLAILAGGYLLINIATTGHLMPVSGAAKQFYSDALRRAAGDPSVWDRLMWVFHGNWRFILVGLTGPWVLLALSLVIPRLKGALAPVRAAWPFYVGALASFLFYSLVFHGGFTQTIWYYGPHTILAVLTLAAGGRVFDELFPRWGQTGLLPLLLLGGALGWFVIPHHPLTSAGMMTTSAWTIAAFGSVGLATLLAHRITRPWKMAGVVVALSASVLLHTQNIRSDVASPPDHWNYNLYQGAQWAKGTLPADATIWSGSAGILGYFSERRVVNTDGLANSYEFLENVLRPGKLLEYYQQWDYGIDAFPTNDELSHLFPEGCYVNLPDDLDRPSFMDGYLERRLQVFKMHAEIYPEIPCAQ